jgi:proteic killer suppression protein/toxin YoeB
MGFDLQKKLKITLNRLDAAVNFNEFLALGLGKPHPLYNNLKGYYGVTLTGNVRLIIKPKETLDSDIFIVKGVCDYHGEKENWIIP